MDKEFFSTGNIIQIAYQVDNVIESAKEWSERFLIGPFFINEHIKLSDSKVRGVDKLYDHSSAYAWNKNIMIELICDHEEVLSPRNDLGGIHHVAWMASNYDEERSSLKNQGFKEVLYSRVQSRQGMQFSWYEADFPIGHFIEVYEESLDLINFYTYLQEISKKWNGKEPLRAISDIS
jgi:hypothetical protein